MMRGYSLEQDLRLLFNNPKYSDIEIICKDEKKLYASRIILAARSEVFDGLLYNGMKESYENQITFPTIYSSGMEIILEYAYIGSIKKESLTKDNIIEAFNTADYFQLVKLQEFIMKTIKYTIEDNYKNNYLPELLSKAVDIMVLSEDNILLNLLVETVATIPLNTIEFGRLSIKALQYLLSCTHKKKKPFATPEYEVFRYSAILVAKNISNNTYKILIKLLPTLEQLENSIKVNNKLITNHKKLARELESLVKFIDFKRIKEQIITDIIEPLEITPTVIVYRSNNKVFNNIRGISCLYEFAYVWDRSTCGSNLLIEDNGKVVTAKKDCTSRQFVRTKIEFEDEGVIEWNVIIKKDGRAWIGVCASENFNYNLAADDSKVLGIGYIGPNSKYFSPFEDNTIITCHLDMNKRTCTFTVNDKKYQGLLTWDPSSKVYPLVSLLYPGQLQIQPFSYNK
ncbi:unnamed protein product [Rhizophagus irregularis]|uniref:BTB domain-containing protein n=1 Tax=Rhizophagus irregularis TaxID=588596 RepID=A0A916E6Q0_9GLOM|nr:unnamed protein product [Rhizophagus irregularis]